MQKQTTKLPARSSMYTVPAGGGKPERKFPFPISTLKDRALSTVEKKKSPLKSTAPHGNDAFISYWSSLRAVAVHLGSTALYVCSALIPVLETVPTFYRVDNRVWFGKGTGWVLSFYGIIDLLSVPFYIELMFGQDASFLPRFSILSMFRGLQSPRPPPLRCDHTIQPYTHTEPVAPRVPPFCSFATISTALITLSYIVPSSYPRPDLPASLHSSTDTSPNGTWDGAMDTVINSDDDPTQLVFVSAAAAAAWFDRNFVYGEIPVPVSRAVDYPAGACGGEGFDPCLDA
ncbi:hypothetical protein DFP72DRAFT_1168728 [Ephemerocybe angulata]|uniref:Uncharacterized protein n=1 Tax=Ephemerocybe angulata TaxID=980116 RepID=A0A8H6M8N3_9AGAR|nr:hypothetical protein DFP72DRAFT_1168728 [Tulosesus angulatus]